MERDCDDSSSNGRERRRGTRTRGEGRVESGPEDGAHHVGEPLVVIDSVLLPRAQSDFFELPSGCVNEAVVGKAINTNKLSLVIHKKYKCINTLGQIFFPHGGVLLFLCLKKKKQPNIPYRCVCFVYTHTVHTRLFSAQKALLSV